MRGVRLWDVILGDGAIRLRLRDVAETVSLACCGWEVVASLRMRRKRTPMIWSVIGPVFILLSTCTGCSQLQGCSRPVNNDTS